MRFRENIIHPDSKPEQKEIEEKQITLYFDRKSYNELHKMKQKLDQLLNEEQKDFKKLFSQIMGFYKWFVDNIIGPPGYDAFILNVINNSQFQWSWQPRETKLTLIAETPDQKPKKRKRKTRKVPINLKYQPAAFKKISDLKEKYDHATDKNTGSFQDLFETAIKFYKAFMDTMFTDPEFYEFHVLGGTMDQPKYEIIKRHRKPKLTLIK